MNEKSLASLYQLLTAADRLETADVDAIVAASEGHADAEIRDGGVARAAASSRHASLVRMLAALRPTSEAFADSVRSTTVAHPQRHSRTAARHASIPHRSRRVSRVVGWAGSIAACLVVALFVTRHHESDVAQIANVVAPAASHSSAADDRIFTAQDRIFASNDHVITKPARHRGDELFRGSFSDG